MGRFVRLIAEPWDSSRFRELQRAFRGCAIFAMEVFGGVLITVGAMVMVMA
jgi:hypothetical protein